MKLLLWNVNGIRAIVKKEIAQFYDLISTYDIVVLNETKIDCKKLTPLIPDQFMGFHSCSTAKIGYSGVSILTKKAPLRRIDPPFEDDEGRVVILEFETYILIGVYVPNAGPTDPNTKMPKRIHFRSQEWDNKFKGLCNQMNAIKPIVVAGDCNVALTEIDVHPSARNKRHAGFTEIERNNFGRLLQDCELIDLWRLMNPSKVQYSYFDYRTKARNRNAGWRIDYILVSKSIYAKCKGCEILRHVQGSDHVPVELVIAIK